MICWRRAVPRGLTRMSERTGAIVRPHDLPGQPQCGLHLSEPVKSSLYPSAPPHVKRTHITNQMKRVQRANGSLAQSGARSPSVLPAENTAKPICSRKTHFASPPTPFSASPRFFRIPSGSPQKTRKPEVNQPSRITAPAIRERAIGDLDPRRNRNATSRKPSCLAHRRQTAGVIEHRTFRQERMTDMSRTQDISRGTHDRYEPNARHFERNA